jgi:hypothetical protein
MATVATDPALLVGCISPVSPKQIYKRLWGHIYFGMSSSFKTASSACQFQRVSFRSVQVTG